MSRSRRQKRYGKRPPLVPIPPRDPVYVAAVEQATAAYRSAPSGWTLAGLVEIICQDRPAADQAAADQLHLELDAGFDRAVALDE